MKGSNGGEHRALVRDAQPRELLQRGVVLFDRLVRGFGRQRGHGGG